MATSDRGNRPNLAAHRPNLAAGWPNMTCHGRIGQHGHRINYYCFVTAQSDLAIANQGQEPGQRQAVPGQRGPNLASPPHNIVRPNPGSTSHL